jgi:hypothetical protein
MKKKLLIIAAVLIALLFLGVVKDQFVKTAVTAGATQVLGAPVRMDNLSLGLLRQSIDIRGFKIFNPKGFPKGILLDVPRISVDYDPLALFKGKLHFQSIHVDLKELVIIKNEEGKLNVDSLSVAKKEEKAGEKKKGAGMPMRIDLLTLSIGRIVQKDFSAKEKPALEVFEVNIKERKFKNITSAQQLATLVLVQAMQASTIKGAGIYSAAAFTGVAFLPLGAAAVLTAKDSSTQEFNVGFERAFKISGEVLRQRGEVISEDTGRGEIKGKIGASEVIIKIQKKAGNRSEITASARKFLLPQATVAAGLIYEISERLNR